MKADHPNIISLKDIFEDEDCVYLVMESCTGGDLMEYIINFDHMTESQACRIMEKVFSALNHLHTIGICHRDIKPENLLLTSKSEDAEIKLIDFGLASKFGNNQEMHSIVGTPYYVAPEVLMSDYGKECDIWSAGVLLYVLLSGRPPFNGNTYESVVRKIMKGDFNFKDPIWQNVGGEAKNLIMRMLLVNPHRRITIP